MTPLQAESHQRHKRFHQAIAERAASVVQDDYTAREAPTPVPILPNPEPEWWPCMWFADLINIRQPKPALITIDYIQRVVAKHFGLKRADLLSQRRTANVVLPRQIAAYLAHELTARSLPEIGRRTGGRDHTTILYSVQKIRARCVSDGEFAGLVNSIKVQVLA